MKIGIVGASGYTGSELMRLCAAHPQFDIAVATGETQAGRPVADLYPNLAGAYGNLKYTPFEPSHCDGLDLVFLGLPHGAAAGAAVALRGTVGHIVDLSADFRLHDPGLYPTWYGTEHPHPELLDDFVFGLPELFRADLAGAELIASPGCYVTTAVLALAPLLEAGVIAPTGIIVDAVSGVSGAGRSLQESTAFCAVDEDFAAYGLLDHRHTPEIEQALTDHVGEGVEVLFTPHLAPMNRGILATCYGRAIGQVTGDALFALLDESYADEPFVIVTDDPPHTKATLGSNTAHVTARVDDRTGWVVAIGALDNLVKGASGQAIQNANLALGLDETMGLPFVGLWP